MLSIVTQVGDCVETTSSFESRESFETRIAPVCPGVGARAHAHSASLSRGDGFAMAVAAARAHGGGLTLALFDTHVVAVLELPGVCVATGEIKPRRCSSSPVVLARVRGDDDEATPHERFRNSTSSSSSSSSSSPPKTVQSPRRVSSDDLDNILVSPRSTHRDTCAASSSSSVDHGYLRSHASDASPSSARQGGCELSSRRRLSELRLAMVDDSLTMRLVFKRLFSAIAPAVTALCAGETAGSIESFAAGVCRHGADVVFVDQHFASLPHLKGTDIVRRIRDLDQHTGAKPRLIFVASSDDAPNDVSLYKLAGADGVCPKKINLPTLLALLRDHGPQGTDHARLRPEL